MPRKRRYFLEPEKPKFEWVGGCVEPHASMRKMGNLPNYQAFKLGELTAEIGDFIIVQGDESSEDILTCDVARIQGLYEDSSDPKDPFRAVVTWLCRPPELPKQLKSHGWEEQGAPPLDGRLDVILDVRNFETNISAETVYFKCNVYSQPMTANPEAFIKRCPASKYPNYILRFKLKSANKGKTKKNFTLEPYQDGCTSPLKLNSKSPLAERKRPSVPREASPGIAPLPKLRISVDLGKLFPDQFDKEESKKRRRLPSGETSRDNTPRKRTKKSDSVPVSPDLDPCLLNTPTRTRITVKTPTSQSKDLGLNGGYWGTDSPKRTPKRTPKLASKVVETPKSNRSRRKSTRPLDDEKDEKEKRKKHTKEKEKKGRKEALQEEEKFTEIVTATGSGRKVKISFGDKNKSKFAPSSGLGSNAISSLLDSDDEDFDQKQTKKQTSKAKEDKKPREPVKRTRRASMSIVLEKKEPKVASKSRRSITMSETKKPRKVIETPEPSSDESDSDFQVTPDYKRKTSRKKKDSSSESEDDVKSKKSAVTPRGKSGKPSAASRRGFTPGVARRAKPINASLNPLVEAQERLHVSAVPDSLPCREDEFSEIFTYVEGKLQDGIGGCIYISGVPGTGKTATVKQVMRYMNENRDEFPDFNYHEMNGMRLTCPEQTYVEMWRLLTGEKLVHEQALKKLDHRFSTPAPKRVHTIFLIDELDMLCKKKQTVLYNIFEWPSRPQGKVIIIAIANTMDLPERDMDMRVISRLGFNRLHFEPYTQLQLQEIVTSRLDGLDVFQKDEIQLVSRKVAGLSGDARRALDICRILMERCEREGRQRVTQLDVLKVHREMFTSPKMMYIRSCSKYEQFFLRAMVNEFYKTGVEETSLGNIVLRLAEICSAEGVQQRTLPAIVDLSARLSSQRLVLSENYSKGLDTKLRLNVGFDDINFALNPKHEMI